LQKVVLLILLLTISAVSVPTLSDAQPAKPALVLGIVVDQFRYDYLLRFRGEYRNGLSRLLSKGAAFANAHYEHVPTVTGVGDSIFLSGAPRA